MSPYIIPNCKLMFTVNLMQAVVNKKHNDNILSVSFNFRTFQKLNISGITIQVTSRLGGAGWDQWRIATSTDGSV